MFFKKLSGKKKSTDIRIDANKLLESMAEDEVYLSPPMLFWKHSGNLAATVAELNENQELEVDTAVLSWQFGRTSTLTEEEEQLFRSRVTDFFTGNGQKIIFSEPVDFFEKTRLSDRI